jgi:hypothetical protein
MPCSLITFETVLRTELQLRVGIAFGQPNVSPGLVKGYMI